MERPNAHTRNSGGPFRLGRVQYLFSLDLAADEVPKPLRPKFYGRLQTLASLVPALSLPTVMLRVWNWPRGRSLHPLQHFGADEVEEEDQVDHQHYDHGQLVEAEEHEGGVAHGEEGCSEGEGPAPALELQEAVGGDGEEQADQHDGDGQLVQDDSDESDTALGQHPEGDDGHAGQKLCRFELRVWVVEAKFFHKVCR